MSTTLTIEAIRRAAAIQIPDTPIRLTYIVPDCWYEAAVEEFKDVPVDIVKQSDTMLPCIAGTE